MQINPIKFWKQVVLSLNGQLDVMAAELTRTRDAFEKPANEDRNQAQKSFQDLLENVKLLNAITAQSEASIASIIAVPSHMEYLKGKLLDNSVVAVNSNELIGAVNKLEYMV